MASPAPYMTALNQPQPPVLPPMAGNPNLPIGATPLTFQDVLKGGGDLFNQGQKVLEADAIMSPGTQRILDIIRQRGAENRARAISEAQALAGRRGNAGSSTEQFGTAEAGSKADDATLTSETNVLLQNLQRQNEANNLRAQGFFQRAGQQGQMTGDELASIRNYDFSLANLALQKQLGEQGLDVARANIGVSKDIADQQAKYGLYGALGSSILPNLLFGGGGGGGAGGGFGGILGNLFGGGGGSAGAFGAPLAPGAIGPVGPGVAGAAAGGIAPGLGTVLGGGGAIVGAGILSSMLDRFMENPLDKAFGQTGGSAARFLLNPVGSTINFGQKLLSNPGSAISGVTNSVSKAVSKVFRF